MPDFLQDWKRTCMCEDLTLDNVGDRVCVMGWVQTRRDLGALLFIDLRDRSGILQVVFDEGEDAELFAKATTLRSEFVVAVRGKVVRRSEDTVNPKIATGQIEVRAAELKILSTSATPPFLIEDDVNTQEAIRLKYRYLDLRRPVMKDNLVKRHQVTSAMRRYLDDLGFVDIETPFLGRSTPEGARDYLVPSRTYPGSFYALPQSPQLLKQLLMVSGFDRYYQIVKCFRDEDLRADRQPEFTQLDIEMSFVQPDDIMDMMEGLMCDVFKVAKGVELARPFRRMTYKEAMDRFGSDKPDLRFGLELVDLSDIVAGCGFKVFASPIKAGGSVRAVNAKGCAGKFARREIDALVDFVKEYGAKGMAWIQFNEDGMHSPITKFLSQEEIDGIVARTGAETGDILFFCADKDDIVYRCLGALRLELARKLNLIAQDALEILWVTEFPLLEYDAEQKRYTAMHHPFTCPMEEDLDKLETDPGCVRAQAYDIVINGTEIGGGSIRIHTTELQERMLAALGFDMQTAWESFGFLMTALKYGAPPHGGIALGLDRLLMLLTGSGSIREVIAFPKLQNANCPMTEAPGLVEATQLQELGISVKIKTESSK